MRYFTYISIIVICLSAVCAYLIFYNPATVPSPAIVINERVVSMGELQKAVTERPAYQSRQEAIDQLISRELLIQKAMERGIDKDPRFLERVRSFYEKNLIQGLLEDWMETITLADVDAATVDRYRELMVKRVTLKKKLFAGGGVLELDRQAPETVTAVEKPFSALSSSLRFRIAEAGRGEQVVLRNGEKRIVYELVGVSPMPDAGPTPSPARLEEMILEAKRQAMLDDWIDGLRRKADINIINTDAGGQS
ncbi:MAG: hypothetical protein SWH68_07095 [Thermodesulfobacteriota bacterium]|nr:hypothetical protein [Thermodesulfobacteriota bacterium]